MIESASENAPYVPPKTLLGVSKSLNEIPLRSLPGQSISETKYSRPKKVKRKTISSKDKILVSLLKDPELYPDHADKQETTFLPPKQFKRKPSWYRW